MVIAYSDIQFAHRTSFISMQLKPKPMKLVTLSFYNTYTCQSNVEKNQKGVYVMITH